MKRTATFALGLCIATAVFAQTPPAQPPEEAPAVTPPKTDVSKAAAEAPQKARPKAKPAPPQPPVENSDRDPFSVTDRIRREAARGTNPAAAPPVVVPELTLKGYGSDGVNPPIALLQTPEEGILFIRPGDLLSVPSRQRTVSLRVREIAPNSVLIEVVETGETIVVR